MCNKIYLLQDRTKGYSYRNVIVWYMPHAMAFKIPTHKVQKILFMYSREIERDAKVNMMYFMYH